VCYVDFQKAFDSVWRTGLSRAMRLLVYEDMRILEALYQDVISAVRMDTELSEWFLTVVGVMQGCVLSPVFFNILLEVVIGLAAGILRSLHHIWKAEDISKPTKVLLYKTLVQSIILHNSET